MLLVRTGRCLLLWALFWGGWGEVIQNDDGTGTISFEPPTLNDEDAHSIHMPPYFQCDACQAIAYQFTKKFDEAHQKRKSLKQLPESEVYELVEAVCSDKFEQYGVKEINKQKRLSGPGLEGEGVAGVMQGGGRWPARLMRTCYQFVENMDEEMIYDAYIDDPKGLSKFLCSSNNTPGVTDVCSKKQNSKKKRKEEL